MNRHLTAEELQATLVDSLSEDKVALLEHLRSCAHCQSSLDQQMDDADVHKWRLLLREDQSVTVAGLDAEFLNRLKDYAWSTAGAKPCPDDEDETSITRFPGPPTPQGPLGQLESYHIIKKLGRGAMGTVYKAFDSRLGREVALKVLKPELAAIESHRARLQREARAATKVKHEHVVTIYDFRTASDFPLPFIVMEYIEGRPLSERLKQEGALSAKEAAKIVQQVASGLVVAHKEQLVHRDIKPSNIMLEKDTGRARLTDFGLARTFEPGTVQLTNPGGIVGTPAYMSPEQAKGEVSLDGRCDIFSLGVVLYELLTGKRPFPSAPPMLLHQIIHEDPHAPRKLHNRIPRDLETITLKCLEKDRRQRYQTAQGLAEDLQRFLAGDPILARPIGRIERGARWVKRRPAIASLIGTVGLALLLGGGFIWKHREAEQESRNAQEIAAAEKRAKYRADLLSYADHISEAHREWQNENITRAKRLLDECPKDFRHWEYGYLRRLCDGSKLTLKGHTTPVRSVAFSPDGKQLGSIGFAFDGQNRLQPAEIKVWDASTGRETAAFKGRPSRQTSGPQDAEPQDDVASWAMPISRAPSPPFARVVFSPNSNYLAAITSDDDVVTIWDLSSGQETLLKGHSKAITSVAFNSEGTLIVSGSYDNTVKVWDAKAGRELHTLRGHRGGIYAIIFGQDGKRMYSAGGDKYVKEWDVTSGREVRTLQWLDFSEEGATNSGGKKLIPIDSDVAFDRGGTHLATCQDGAVKVWDMNQGRQLTPIKGNTWGAKSLALSSGRKYLAASFDKTIRVWQTGIGTEPVTLKGHAREVTSLAFSPNGERLASSSVDGTVKVWDTTKNADVIIPEAGVVVVENVAFRPESQLLTTSGLQGKVKVWDVTTGQVKLSLEGQKQWIKWVAFSSDGQLLASASGIGPPPETLSGWVQPEPGDVKVWDTAAGRIALTLKGHDWDVTCLAFSPNGQWLASAHEDARVRIWDLKTGREIRALVGHTSRVNSVAFSPDGRRLASAGGELKLWDVTTGKEILDLKGHTGNVQSVVFSSKDGKRLASGGNDQTIKVWDATTGQEILTLEGHAGSVNSVAFSPDDKRLASASSDQTIKIWESTTGQALLTFKAHTGPISCVVFSPDGKRLASSSYDGTVKVRDATPIDETRVEAAPSSKK